MGRMANTRRTIRRGAILACVLLGFGASIVTAASIATVVSLDPFTPVRAPSVQLPSTQTEQPTGPFTLTPLPSRPPIRDPFRPPTRSPFIP